jgi:hypothetical protein
MRAQPHEGVRINRRAVPKDAVERKIAGRISIVSLHRAAAIGIPLHEHRYALDIPVPEFLTDPIQIGSPHIN